MKVLIVDDEKHVRDAVKILVDWENYGIYHVYEAPEGLTAIDIIQQERPEIIFTDMVMPVKDGAELLAWIHQHHPHCKTIVISGHDDFSFMRHTINYGGMDYILKPIDAEQLNEALHRAVRSWQRDEHVRHQQQNANIQMNQIKPVYWESVFSNLIDEPHLYPALAQQLEAEFGLHKRTESIQVAVLSASIMPRFLSEKYENNRDLLFFSLANICNEYLKRERMGYAFRHWSHDHELVIMAWDKTEYFVNYIEEMNEGICRTLGSRLHFGIGAVKAFHSGLADAYEGARGALNDRNLLLRGATIHLRANVPTSQLSHLHFTDHEERFKVTLLSQHDGQIANAVDDWFKDIRQLKHISINQLMLWWNEYTVFYSRCLQEYVTNAMAKYGSELRSQQKFEITVDDDGHFSLDLWQDVFVLSLQRLSSIIADEQQKETNFIYDIADYIEQHYAKEITLQFIAERYFLSREYISRKFKQEMGENLSEYISRIRMDKAKLLLVNPQLRIADIAEMVGYHDEKYFSKVFKKVTGLSPSLYRKKQM